MTHMTWTMRTFMDVPFKSIKYNNKSKPGKREAEFAFLMKSIFLCILFSHCLRILQLE